MNNITKAPLRFLAGLLDLSILNLPFVYILYRISSITEVGKLFSSLLNFVILLMSVAIVVPIINSFMISSIGGTIGKLLTGTKIVTAENENLGFWKAFFRNHIAYLVSKMIFSLGFIWILIDKERRGWHDMMANTYVVTVNKYLSILGLLVLIGVLGTHTFLIKNSFVNFINNKDMYVQLLNVDALINELNKNSVPLENIVLNEKTINAMSIVAFSKVNEVRKAKNIKELKLDSRLCAYSQRRLEQLNNLGKLDDGKGFYEDTVNPDLKNAYFIENPMVGELSRKMVEADFTESGISAVVDFWANIENSNILNPSFKNGCIRADENFMIFTLGGK